MSVIFLAPVFFTPDVYCGSFPSLPQASAGPTQPAAIALILPTMGTTMSDIRDLLSATAVRAGQPQPHRPCRESMSEVGERVRHHVRPLRTCFPDKGDAVE